MTRIEVVPPNPDILAIIKMILQTNDAIVAMNAMLLEQLGAPPLLRMTNQEREDGK